MPAIDIEDDLHRRLAPEEWDRLQRWLEGKTLEQRGEALGYALGYIKTAEPGAGRLPKVLDSMLLLTRGQRIH